MTASLAGPRATPEDLARYSVPADRTAEVLAALRAVPQVGEAVVVSTCQRVEVTACIHRGAELLGLLDQTAHFAGCASSGRWRTYFGLEAIHHLVRVSSGLDSAAVGETEIANQVKTAYARATEQGAVGRHLHAFLRFAIESAKWIRTEYGLESRVAPIGQRVADNLLAELKDHDESALRVLVIGAGEVASSVLTALSALPAVKLSLANRTAERAAALAAEHGATVVGWGELAQVARGHEAIVAAAQADQPLLSVSDLAGGAVRLIVDVGLNPVIDPATLAGRGIAYLNRKMLDARVKLTADQRAVVQEAEMAINRHVIAFQAEMIAAHAKSGLSAHREELLAGVRRCLEEELEGVDEQTVARIEKRLFFLFAREIADVLNFDAIPEPGEAVPV